MKARAGQYIKKPARRESIVIANIGRNYSEQVFHGRKLDALRGEMDRLQSELGRIKSRP